MNIGIVGASGYTGETLVALLADHPHADLVAVASRSQAGKPLGVGIPRLRGSSIADLPFVSAEIETLARIEVDTWFLALPHGVATTFAQALLQAGKTVIDLSADFRLSSPETYQTHYGNPHPAPALLETTPYVLPELTPTDAWSQAKLIACPGCYPTSILLPLIPLLRANLVDPDSIIINSYSGVSGAGKKAVETFLYCERNESMKAYGVTNHRHLSEIEEQLSAAAGKPIQVQFTPHLAPMNQGILSTIVVAAPHTAGEAIHSCWESTYTNAPCVALLPPGSQPDPAHVSKTNRADMAVVKDNRTGNLILTCAIDNLVKGAGGQAIQIFNQLQGWPQHTGLPL